jgi:hypothetical protein
MVQKGLVFPKRRKAHNLTIHFSYEDSFSLSFTGQPGGTNGSSSCREAVVPCSLKDVSAADAVSAAVFSDQHLSAFQLHS